LNIDDDTELDETIAELRSEALLELCQDCQDLIIKQNNILARIQIRLAQN
jgi:hypothetical protein